MVNSVTVRRRARQHIVLHGTPVVVTVPAQAKMSPPPELQQLALNLPATFLVVALLNNNRRFHLHGALYTAFHYQ